jgi:hypothetical protein
MRAALVAVVVGVVLAFAPSASAGVFPDLPGMDGVERLTDVEKPSSSKASTVTQNVTKSARVPDSDQKSSQPTAASVTDTKFIHSLPGGKGLPVLGDAAASPRESATDVAALALVVCVLFTRFLFRLNRVAHVRP